MIRSSPEEDEHRPDPPRRQKNGRNDDHKHAEGGGDQAERDERHPRGRVEERPRPVDDPV